MKAAERSDRPNGIQQLFPGLHVFAAQSSTLSPSALLGKKGFECSNCERTCPYENHEALIARFLAPKIVANHIKQSRSLIALWFLRKILQQLGFLVAEMFHLCVSWKLKRTKNFPLYVNGFSEMTDLIVLDYFSLTLLLDSCRDSSDKYQKEMSVLQRTEIK